MEIVIFLIRHLAKLILFLSAWTKTGSQLILRFLYDWDGQNLESEPTELSQILTHMEQVGPIVNKYAHLSTLSREFLLETGER